MSIANMMLRITSSSHLIIRRATLPTLQRHFHGTQRAHETVGEKVRDLGHKVNLKMGQSLASAIDTGEKVTHATKEKVGSTKTNAEEGKEYIEKKADEATKEAQKVKENIKNEMAK